MSTSSELIPLDPTCPYCGLHSGVGEIFDGGDHDCVECDRSIVAIAWSDGTMTMRRPAPHRFAWTRTGRQRTRALWRRRGRR